MAAISLWGPTPRARRALFRVLTCLVPVGQRSPYRSCALSPCFPSLVPYHLTAAKENAMAIAPYLRVFALAPLACLITTALAMGGPATAGAPQPPVVATGACRAHF